MTVSFYGLLDTSIDPRLFDHPHLRAIRTRYRRIRRHLRRH